MRLFMWRRDQKALSRCLLAVLHFQDEITDPSSQALLADVCNGSLTLSRFLSLARSLFL